MISSINSIRTASRFNLAALAIAALVCLVALGGTSHAAGGLIGAKKIKNNSISSKKIKNNGVKSLDLANGTIEMVDLSGPLQAKVNQLVGGLVDTAQLVNGAVTNPKLADNSVDSSKVASNSLTAHDIKASAVGAVELASNAVDRDEVANGGLDAEDVGQYSGSAIRNFAPISDDECASETIDPSPSAASLDSRAIVVTPSAPFSDNVSFHAEAEGDSLRLVICNNSGGPVDPDGAGTNYNYIVFGS